MPGSLEAKERPEVGEMPAFDRARSAFLRRGTPACIEVNDPICENETITVQNELEVDNLISEMKKLVNLIVDKENPHIMFCAMVNVLTGSLPKKDIPFEGIWVTWILYSIRRCVENKVDVNVSELSAKKTIMTYLGEIEDVTFKCDQFIFPVLEMAEFEFGLKRSNVNLRNVFIVNIGSVRALSAFFQGIYRSENLGLGKWVEQVESLFRLLFGNLKSVYVPVYEGGEIEEDEWDEDYCSFKGYCFVEMETFGDAKRAVEMLPSLNFFAFGGPSQISGRMFRDYSVINEDFSDSEDEDFDELDVLSEFRGIWHDRLSVQERRLDKLAEEESTLSGEGLRRKVELERCITVEYERLLGDLDVQEDVYPSRETDWFKQFLPSPHTSPLSSSLCDMHALKIAGGIIRNHSVSVLQAERLRSCALMRRYRLTESARTKLAREVLVQRREADSSAQRAEEAEEERRRCERELARSETLLLAAERKTRDALDKVRVVEQKLSVSEEERVTAVRGKQSALISLLGERDSYSSVQCATKGVIGSRSFVEISKSLSGTNGNETLKELKELLSGNSWTNDGEDDITCLENIEAGLLVASSIIRNEKDSRIRRKQEVRLLL